MVAIHPALMLFVNTIEFVRPNLTTRPSSDTSQRDMTRPFSTRSVNTSSGTEYFVPNRITRLSTSWTSCENRKQKGIPFPGFPQLCCFQISQHLKRPGLLQTSY